MNKSDTSKIILDKTHSDEEKRSFFQKHTMV